MSAGEDDAAGIIKAAEDGPPIATRADANDLIALAWGTDAQVVAVPLARMDPSVFRLENGQLGEILQAFTNYRIRLAIVGDVSAVRARSRAFDALVIEADRGRGVIFASDTDALRARLAAEGGHRVDTGAGQASPGAGSSR